MRGVHVGTSTRRTLGGPELSGAGLCRIPSWFPICKSCRPSHSTVRGLNRGQRGWESLEDLCVPRPRCRHGPRAELRACPSSCDGPRPFRTAEPFHLKRGLCRVQLRIASVLRQADGSAHRCSLGSPPPSHPQRLGVAGVLIYGKWKIRPRKF